MDRFNRKGRFTREPPSRRMPTKRTNSYKFSARDFVKRHDSTTSGNELVREYEFGKLLGSGAYGEVYVATHKVSGSVRAVKTIDKTIMDDYDHEQVANEFKVLQTMDHPNVLKLYDMFEDSQKYYFVMEICKGGELLDEMDERGQLSEAGAALLMKQVLSSVHYCHRQKIVHRDLKLENILLEESKELDQIKVIDFGLATDYKDEALSQPVGSAHYVAPEVLEGNYGPKCDIWSCGVIAYILLCGFAPFDGDSDHDIREQIILGDVYYDDPVWDTVSPEGKDFVKQLLTYDPTSRVSAAQALQHPWIESVNREYSEKFKKGESKGVVQALTNCLKFSADTKLKQAVCAYIASQLLNKDDKVEIDEVFRVIDADCDGRLSKSEVSRSFEEFMGESMSQRQLDDFFNRIDFAATGYIEYSEFVIASMDVKSLMDETKMRAAFQQYDIDGTGIISIDNLRVSLKEFYGENTEDEVYSIIVEQVDADGDGKINFEDFTKMMAKEAEPFQREGNDSAAKTEGDDLQKNEALDAMNKRIEQEQKADEEQKEPEQEKVAAPKKPMLSKVGAGSMLHISVFEQNIQKNKERGYEKFEYTRKTKGDRRQRPLPRTRRLNFQELTKKATVQIDFNAKSRQEQRHSELAQLAQSVKNVDKRSSLEEQRRKEQEKALEKKESRSRELQNIRSSGVNARRRSSVFEQNIQKNKEFGMSGPLFQSTSRLSDSSERSSDRYRTTRLSKRTVSLDLDRKSPSISKRPTTLEEIAAVVTAEIAEEEEQDGNEKKDELSSQSERPLPKRFASNPWSSRSRGGIIHGRKSSSLEEHPS